MDSNEAIDILLIEDSPADLELTLRALERIAPRGAIRSFHDGTEALDFLRCRGNGGDRSHGQQVRVVLLDINLPRISGLEVLKAIKADETLRAIPVIMLSSSREENDVATAYRYGANSYVAKPIEFEKFVHAVSQIGLYWLSLNEVPR